MYPICGFDPTLGPPTYQAVLARIHPEDRARVDQIVQSAAVVGRRVSGEYRLLMPEGTTKHIYFAGGPVPVGDDAEGLGFVGTITDITDERVG